jgi:hypothetical protein
VKSRIAAGAAVLGVLALMSALLIPPYVKNWKLQSYLDSIAEDPASASKAPDVLQANVLNRAAELGLPVHSEDVHVKRTGSALHIEVLYVVHVELLLYSVDLHFRPKE